MSTPKIIMVKLLSATSSLTSMLFESADQLSQYTFGRTFFESLDLFYILNNEVLAIQENPWS